MNEGGRESEKGKERKKHRYTPLCSMVTESKERERQRGEERRGGDTHTQKEREGVGERERGRERERPPSFADWWEGLRKESYWHPVRRVPRMYLYESCHVCE